MRMREQFGHLPCISHGKKGVTGPQHVTCDIRVHQMTKHSILIQLDVQGTNGFQEPSPAQPRANKQIRNEAIAEYSDIHNPNMQNQTHQVNYIQKKRHRIVQPIQPQQHCLDKMRARHKVFKPHPPKDYLHYINASRVRCKPTLFPNLGIAGSSVLFHHKRNKNRGRNIIGNEACLSTNSVPA